MRRILFRGKRIDNGEWVVGYYAVTPLGKHLIHWKPHWKPFEEATSNTYHEVQPESVGQFTGLLDKNGRDIYEGDIVKYTYTHYRKPIEVITDVHWKYHGFYIGKNQTKIIDSRVLTLSKSIMEIIGNIYETPNLLTN